MTAPPPPPPRTSPLNDRMKLSTSAWSGGAYLVCGSRESRPCFKPQPPPPLTVYTSDCQTLTGFERGRGAGIKLTYPTDVASRGEQDGHHPRDLPSPVPFARSAGLSKVEGAEQVLAPTDDMFRRVDEGPHAHGAVVSWQLAGTGVQQFWDDVFKLLGCRRRPQIDLDLAQYVPQPGYDAARLGQRHERHRNGTSTSAGAGDDDLAYLVGRAHPFWQHAAASPTAREDGVGPTVVEDGVGDGQCYAQWPRVAGQRPDAELERGLGCGSCCCVNILAGGPEVWEHLVPISVQHGQPLGDDSGSGSSSAVTAAAVGDAVDGSDQDAEFSAGDAGTHQRRERAADEGVILQPRS